MEISIPVVYCISFVIAYYGPNAEILGNVKNDYWQYQKVNSVFDKLRNNAIFIVVDAIRGAIIGLLLKRFCKLNFLRTYCEIISSYGILVLVYVSGALAVVSRSIHCVLFSWHELSYFIALIIYLIIRSVLSIRQLISSGSSS